MTEYDASSFFLLSFFLSFLLLTISGRRSRVAQERDEWLLMRLDSFYTDVISLPIGHPSLEDWLVAACNRRRRPPHIIDEPTQFSFYFFFFPSFLVSSTREKENSIFNFHRNSSTKQDNQREPIAIDGKDFLVAVLVGVEDF
jgi:hypothetical protein